jgi:hypothetical protein
MNTRRKLAVGAAIVLGAGGLSAGLAIAAGAGAGDDQPLTGATLEKATAAALAYTGGGTVIETEVGDDGAAYGVEIRLDHGGVVEVELDGNFGVVGDEADDDEAGDEDGAGGD